jgi:serine protease Do
VTIQEITPELSQKFGLKTAKGALIGDVAKGSPADRAGLRRGDILVEFNGKKVDDVGNLRNMVAQSKVGAQIPLVIIRSGKEYAVKVTTTELPKEASETAPGNALEEEAFEGLAGLNVIELTSEISRQLGLARDEKGVVVVRVDPGSSIEDAGLRKGDVIQEIDRKKIARLDDYTRIAANVRSGDTVLMFVNRGGRKFYLTVEAD